MVSIAANKPWFFALKFALWEQNHEIGLTEHYGYCKSEPFFSQKGSLYNDRGFSRFSGYTPLKQLVEKVHTFCLLLEICTAVNIQRERNIFVSENFREWFDVELWHFNCSDSKSVANFVKFHFFQFVSFQKAWEELAIGARLCRFCLASQKVVIRVIRIELFDNVHEQGRNRDGSRRSFCFRWSYINIGFTFFLS